MGMTENLYSFYGFAKKSIAPNLQYSQDIYEEVLKEKVNQEVAWLDLGCGHHLLPQWNFEREKQLVSRAKTLVGVDFDLPSLKKHRSFSLLAQCTIDELPFPDSYFDVATANMVVEHLDNPKIQFTEISRILKPGGVFIFHTVNEAGYFSILRKMTPNFLVKKASKALDGREAEDVFEVHYRANKPELIDSLAAETNFAVDEIKLVSSDAVFAKIPPLAVIELIWIRILMKKSFKKWRTNLIVTLRKR
jgi:ubiquinone/menaquinone biosynthesis C-methylase UbiE